MTSTMRDLNSDMEAASVLTAISNSPARVTHRPSVVGTPPGSPSFSFQDFRFNHSNSNSNHTIVGSLCNTPVPVGHALPFLTPSVDLSKNMLSPLPLGPDTLDKGYADGDVASKLLLGLKDRTGFAKNLNLEVEVNEPSHYTRNNNFYQPTTTRHYHGGQGSPHQLHHHHLINEKKLETLPLPSSSFSRNLINKVTSTPATANITSSPRLPSVPSMTPKPLLINPKTPQSQLIKKNKLKKRKKVPSAAPSSSSKVVSSSQEDEEDDFEEADDDDEPSSSNSPKPCKCKRSRCLKLYCDCFGAQRFCVKSCTCVDCSNTGRPDHEATRKEAIVQTLERNPNAFSSKILATPQSAQHAKGCHCKRSNCLKKYCECFALNVRCSDHCKCNECLNRNGSEALEAAKSPSITLFPTLKNGNNSSTKKKKLNDNKSNNNSNTKKTKKNGLSSIAEEEEEENNSSGLTQDEDDHIMKVNNNNDNAIIISQSSQHSLHLIQTQSFSDLEEALDITGVGENTMDSSLFSSQESKGSLGSRKIVIQNNNNKRKINWGFTIGDIEEDVTKKILEWLPTPDLLTVACVSRGFAEVATSPEFWHFPETATQSTFASNSQ